MFRNLEPEERIWVAEGLEKLENALSISLPSLIKQFHLLYAIYEPFDAAHVILGDNLRVEYLYMFKDPYKDFPFMEHFYSFSQLKTIYESRQDDSHIEFYEELDLLILGYSELANLYVGVGDKNRDKIYYHDFNCSPEKIKCIADDIFSLFEEVVSTKFLNRLSEIKRIGLSYYHIFNNQKLVFSDDFLSRLQESLLRLDNINEFRSIELYFREKHEGIKSEIEREPNWGGSKDRGILALLTSEGLRHSFYFQVEISKSVEAKIKGILSLSLDRSKSRSSRIKYQECRNILISYERLFCRIMENPYRYFPLGEGVFVAKDTSLTSTVLIYNVIKNYVYVIDLFDSTELNNFVKLLPND